MSLSPELRNRITELVQSNSVVLFMKGNRHQPQCGFSARVVGMLDGLTSDYETFDVLSDPEVREGIKEFSNWPTIPQLYVKGEFMGGSDIVEEMFASGELHKALGVERLDPITPTISITRAAVQVLEQAVPSRAPTAGCTSRSARASGTHWASVRSSRERSRSRRTAGRSMWRTTRPTAPTA